MKKYVIISILLATALLFCSCAKNNEAKVKNVIKEFETAANAKDFSGVLNVLPPDTKKSLSKLISSGDKAFDYLVYYYPNLSDFVSTSTVSRKIDITLGELTVTADSEIYASADVSAGIEGEKDKIEFSCYFVMTQTDGEWYISDIEFLS